MAYINSNLYKEHEGMRTLNNMPDQSITEQLLNKQLSEDSKYTLLLFIYHFCPSICIDNKQLRRMIKIVQGSCLQVCIVGLAAIERVVQ